MVTERETSSLGLLARREALCRVALTAGGLVGTTGLTALAWSPGGLAVATPEGERVVRDFRAVNAKGEVQLSVALGPANGAEQAAIAAAVGESTTQSIRSLVPSAAELTRRAVDGLGGMARFVSRGDVVAIKPNIGWDRLPAHAANSNPEVVSTVVQLVLDAGAASVVVTDASCNDARRSFLRSGIWRASHAMGAEVVLPAEHRFRQMRLRGDVLDQWPVYTPLMNADKVINIPVAKHHNLSRYTGAMKNWYGLLGGRRNRLHQNIDVSIADLATFMRPTLTILDATRVLLRNGPQGGNLNDARELNQVVASLDQVAVDAYGCTLIGERPERVRYLQLAEERGIGLVDYKTLNWVRV